MPEITLDTIVAASRDQVSSDLGGEIAILGLRRSMYYSVTGAGTRIWELLQTPRPVSEILDVLRSQFAVDADRCRRDLLDLLHRLRDEGLVEVVDGVEG